MKRVKKIKKIVRKRNQAFARRFEGIQASSYSLWQGAPVVGSALTLEKIIEASRIAASRGGIDQ